MSLRGLLLVAIPVVKEFIGKKVLTIRDFIYTVRINIKVKEIASVPTTLVTAIVVKAIFHKLAK